MPWLRLTINTRSEDVQPLTELLQQFGAGSISHKAVSDDEALYGDTPDTQSLWQHTSTSALLDHELDMDILLACVRNRIGTSNILSHKIELLEDRNWDEAYKSEYGPMLFGEKLYVYPSWFKSSDIRQPAIIMDPGLAFGTGAHATTALCLKWLTRNDLMDRAIIDYGCGSGILALAAARLGAAEVYAVDNDPQALMATQSNAERNHLQSRINIFPAGQCKLPAADVLIANILMKPLLELATTFNTLVQPGGCIALSGILAGQVQTCLQTYNRWFEMAEPEFIDEWAIIYGYR